jgi:23S rRNA maturation mini-RNase III
MAKRPKSEAELNEAWIGDAVLSLHARLKILRDHGRIDAPLAASMTSNQFLSCAGEPTSVEAAIGRVYLDHGLLAAFEHIDSRLAPLFERQQAKRARR